MTLTREQILTNKAALKSETVDVPEWGGNVIVQELLASEADAYSASLTRMVPGPERGAMVPTQDLANHRAKLVVRCIVGDDGTRVFGDADANAIGAMSSAIIGKLYDVAVRLSGISSEAQEDAEGESEAVPSDGSNSTSPENSDNRPAGTF